MYRLIALLLALALLLSGCAGSGTEQPSNASTVHPTQTAPTAPIEPERQPTAGGVTVQTDYSAYQPRAAAPAPNYTRASDAFVSELSAGDYGTLYPFIGSTLRSYGEMGYVSSPSCVYGLTDADGRILVDPVYLDVFPLEGRTTHAQLPFLLLTQAGETNSQGSDCFYGLVSSDGSFVLPCKYDYISAYEPYIIAVSLSDDDGYSFEIYDLDGTLCLSSDTLPFRDRLYRNYYGYYSGVAYGEGLFTVDLRVDGLENPQTYYMDLEGNLVYGPYYSAAPFSDGYATVQLEAGSARILRRSGELLEQEFVWVDTIIDGIAIVTEQDTNHTVALDLSDGSVRLDAGDGYLIQDKEMFELYDGEQTVCYDRSFAPLYAISSEEIRYGGSDIFYSSGETSELHLKNYATGKEAVVPFSPYSYTSPQPLEFGETLPYAAFLSYDPETYRDRYLLVDESLNILLSGDGYLSFLYDSSTGRRYLAVADTRQTVIYDEQLTPLCSLPCKLGDTFLLYGGRVICRTASGSYQFDLRGNALFYFPLLSEMDD